MDDAREATMGHALRTHDLALLDDVLALTGPGGTAVPAATETLLRVLDLLEDLLHADLTVFHDTHVGALAAFGRTCALSAQAGRHTTPSGDELTTSDREANAAVMTDYWWQLPCSLVDRTGVAQVSTLRTFFGEREWAVHPLHVDYLPVVDELLLAHPVGGGWTLRILAARESGPAFGPRELTLARLLLPHLLPLLRAARTEMHGSAPVQQPVLTGRQRQILQLVAQGMGNRQLSRQLGISEGTVRKHLENAYERLGVQSRTEAVFRMHHRSAPG